MEKFNKKELLEHIKKQDVEITKYRTRFRDVVAAYKGLQNEKLALENSLKALSSRDHRNESLSLAVETPVSSEDGREQTSESTDASVLNEGGSEESSSEDLAAGDRIDALSKALVTLTEEKTRNETSLLADKRKCKQELDELRKEFVEQQTKFEQEKASFQKTAQELRSDLCKEQQQRKEDHNQHQLMMRELQSKLIIERTSKEKIDQQYENLLLQQKANSVHSNQQRTIEEYDRMLEEMTVEMSRLRKSQQEALDKARGPNPMLMKLQGEMQDIKVKHQEVVEDEQRQSTHAKAELRSLALSSETRITSLEAKVTELSQMIGNYDRLRTQDQQSIQKLKERIAQLDLEKTLLLQQQIPSSRSTSCGEDEQEDSNLDVHALAEKITKLKDLLYLANQRSQNPIDTQVLLRFHESPVQESDIHSRCKEELQQLKDEFEHYKSRAQTVLRNKAAKDQENHGEIDLLIRQIGELKSRLHSSRAHCDKQLKASEEKLQAVQHEHRQQLRQLRAQLESDHSGRILEMEQQIQKQRERTLALLDEKEQELANKERQLASLQDGLLFPTPKEKHESHKSESVLSVGSPATIESSNSLPEMLSQAMSSSSGDHLILHYVQDIARKDVEIGNLRRCRHQAETSLRELQHEVQINRERYQDDIEALQAKIYRLESSQSEEGVNMEYLKNVVLKYILCKDTEGKRRILNAIAAVLHFTVRELELARMGL